MSYRFRPFNGAEDWAWIKARIRILRVEDTCGLMAENSRGETVGAAIFDSFLYSSAQVALIMETPMLVRAGFLDAAYDFVFNTCGRKLCYAMIADTNERSLRLSRRVGWREKMRIPDGYSRGVDYIVYELHRDRYQSYRRRTKRAA